MEVDGLFLTILGTLAGILILTGWVEQIYKGYKTKSMQDISKFLMIFIAAGSTLWLVYGSIVSDVFIICLLYTSPSPRDRQKSRMPSSA